MLLSLGSHVARADDWLAALPECRGNVAPPITALLYPREGLPALIASGETLHARVRLSVPLTPPPGVQQERALEGFAAQLIGHARALGSMQEHRYPLQVLDVRPEGPSSLRYRVALAVPAWVAPGTYDFALTAKGAQLLVASSVRVIGAGDRARLAWLRDAGPPRYADAALLPIDVWVHAETAEHEASAREASPEVSPSAPAPNVAVLEHKGLVAALRVGDKLWVIGDCDAPYVSFASEVETVLATERRTRIAPSARLHAEPWQPFDAGARAWPAADATSVQRQGEGLLARAGEPLELSLWFAADGRGLRASAGALRFYPAGELGTASALIARLTLASAGSVRIERGPRAPFEAALRLAPDPVRSGEALRARLEGSRPIASVALRFDHRRTAFATGVQGADLRRSFVSPAHRYLALGPQKVAGLAISQEGVARPLSAKVTVATTRRFFTLGCGVARGRSAVGSAMLWCLPVLLQRRRNARVGNRLRSGPRS